MPILSYLNEPYVRRELIESGLYDDKYAWEIAKVVNLVGVVRYQLSVWALNDPEISGKSIVKSYYGSLKRAKSELEGNLRLAERSAAKSQG